MNVYQAFFTLKPGIKDMDFVQALHDYMEYLVERGDLQKWRLLRRKLGLGPSNLGEFQLLMEFQGLADLDRAFGHVASRTGEVESKHFCVNHMVEHAQFSLYRDFPDASRQVGGELFWETVKCMTRS